MEYTSIFHSVGNARDLGGYPACGKTVKHGLLLRTSSLAALSPSDRDKLENVYHVAAVVDFRMGMERELAPDPEIHSAAYHTLSVIEPEDYPRFDPELAKMLFDSDTDRLEMLKIAYEMGMVSDRLYVDFLFSERGKAAYRAFFRLLFALDEGRAVLWHCTDGKDRTGIASMLLLTALGAERETVLADYLLTNKYNAQKLAAVRAGLERAPLTPELRELALFGAGAVEEKYMISALNAMDEFCGSAEGYLAQELGIEAAEREELRRKYLE